MKTTRLFATCSATLLAVLSAQAQGTFQNLGFEQADPVVIVGSPYYPTAVTFGSALPGWSSSIGGVPVTQAFLNNYSLGAASISIFGPGWNSVNPGIIDGNYTVFLQGSTQAKAMCRCGKPARFQQMRLRFNSALGTTHQLTKLFLCLSPVTACPRFRSAPDNPRPDKFTLCTEST